MSGEKGNGAQGRDRTTDTAIFSRMLYQLSYLGTALRLERGAAYSDASVDLSSAFSSAGGPGTR